MMVSELSAHEAATTSGEIWDHKGELKAGQQLLFYALTKDRNCDRALLVLTDMLEGLAGRQVAVVVTEYAYGHVKDAAIKSRMTLVRRIGLFRLNLLSHPAGNISELSLEDWQHSADFVEDEKGIANVTKKLLGARTKGQAFDAMVLLLGVRAGLMEPKTSNAVTTEFDDCFHSGNFTQAAGYSDFLSAEKLKTEF